MYTVFPIQIMSNDNRSETHRRTCRTANIAFNEHASGSDEDPFKDNDNDKDVDYIPSPKKVCLRSKLPAGTKKKIKPLTARERIERLKRKTSLYKQTSNTDVPVVQTNSIESEVRTQPETSSVETSEQVTFQNHDNLFDQVEISDKSITSPVNLQNSVHEDIIDLEFEPPPPTEIFGSTHELNNEILESIRILQGQFTDLTSSITLLRKQVSRIEMKTMATPLNGVTSRVSGGSTIDPDFLDDFDDSMAKEGFPFNTCVEINDFENKLRNDSQYRNKMVRFCNCIHIY